ncbi:hypothetical protein N0V86_006769 [Didymella sp. IMI 355093]|nr:hypothetical protein N0V86_006769 [Didymella sp. IMI 355093]
MAPNKQTTIIARKRSGAERGRLPKLQAAPSPALSNASTPGPKLKLKISFKRGEIGHPDERDAPAYQFPLHAPPSEDVTVQDDGYVSVGSIEDSYGRRRGARQRKPPQRGDVVYGSEMDNLIASSATLAKAEDDEYVGMDSSPPHIISIRAPDRYNSPATVQEDNSPLPRFDHPVSQDVYNILNTLRSSPEIQVDLPNMMNNEAGISEPYTNALLTSLYIQCYQNGLWHICDLVADTWIRALQVANQRSQKSNDKRCLMWRKNTALESKFKQGKLGFKQETQDLGLDIEDPDMAADVTKFIPEHISTLYAHTQPKCGARLLWADAMALRGRTMESEMTRRPGVWPRDAFYDVMCTGLRLVGRKLTLKIEEKYEGAWCRYHEHGRHGLPCYRQLAALQNDTKGDAGRENGLGRKRARGDGGSEEKSAKRVRFGGGDAGAAPRVIDFDDVDAEGESEEG